MDPSSVQQIARDLLELSRKLEEVRTSSRISDFSHQAPSVTPRFVAGSTIAKSASTNSHRPQNSSNNNHNNGYLSDIEQAVLRSVDPILTEANEEFELDGLAGIWLNKAETDNWHGELPIDQYKINQDPEPEIITKRSSQKLQYVQELAIRYLRPPTPPAPGEIIINQEPNKLLPPAPPIIIRQQPPRPPTPEPLVVREAPPPPPPQVGRKVITISGKRLPPAPRKVVIERLAPLPSKPQSVIIERWLPYREVKRRVIFNKSAQPDPVVFKPKNVIVQWEAPEVKITKEYKYLGVVRANPVEYVQRYGHSLVTSKDLPTFVKEIATPDGLVLAADSRPIPVPELEGDIDALHLIDLDREGLGEYKSYLLKKDQHEVASPVASSNNNGLRKSESLNVDIATANTLASASALANAQLNSLVDVLFSQIDKHGTGTISVEDAERLMLRLNSRLGRNYGEDDVKLFFNQLNKNSTGLLNLNEFREAFLNITL